VTLEQASAALNTQYHAISQRRRGAAAERT
jgi:hypothetical protein